MFKQVPDSAENDRGRLQRLQAELQERDDVLAMAAHELRNPLHALAMQLTLACSTAEAQGHTDTLVRIQKAQATLSRYVDRVTVLMDLVRANADDYPLAVQTFDVTATLRQVVDQLQPDALFRGVEIRCELPAECLVRADPLVIEQVVDNLLLNALKHAACTIVVVRLQIAAGWVEIEVADNGRGIEIADQERIFSKFSVARQGERGSGSGLGLWIVSKLLRAIGGGISLNSRPASGSVFKLRFPMTHSSTQSPEQPPT